MNIEIIHRDTTFGRVLELCRLIVLTNGGQALVAELESIHTYIGDLGGKQVAASNESSAGVAARAIAAAALRSDLRAVCNVARRLDRTQFPGMAERFRMPRTNGYTEMRNTARACLDKMDPETRQLFVDRLGSELFDRMADLLNDFAANSERKDTGRNNQISHTAALWQAARRGLAIVRELDPIIRVVWRNQPELIAAWKSASHVERRHTRKAEGRKTSSEGSTPVADAAPPQVDTAQVGLENRTPVEGVTICPVASIPGIMRERVDGHAAVSYAVALSPRIERAFCC